MNGDSHRKKIACLKKLLCSKLQKCVKVYNPLTRAEMGHIMGDSMVVEEEGGLVSGEGGRLDAASGQLEHDHRPSWTGQSAEVQLSQSSQLGNAGLRIGGRVGCNSV